jgi:hypothetical protein
MNIDGNSRPNLGVKVFQLFKTSKNLILSRMTKKEERWKGLSRVLVKTARKQLYFKRNL